jgi:hypothetical protein
LNEIGQQNENIGRRVAVRSSIICAPRKIVYNKRRLVRLARLLCCAHLDAAMHNRRLRIGFDFRLQQEQHQTDAIDASLRHRFELPCSLKNK